MAEARHIAIVFLPYENTIRTGNESREFQARRRGSDGGKSI